MMNNQDTPILFTSEQLHLSVGQDMMAMTPFNINYLHARMKMQAMTDEGTTYFKHYVPELQWKQIKPSEMFGKFNPLMAFDDTVLAKLSESVRRCLGENQTPEAEALRRENEHLRMQNQKLIDTLLGVVERRTK
jgi:hypothetical protein